MRDNLVLTLTLIRAPSLSQAAVDMMLVLDYVIVCSLVNWPIHQTHNVCVCIVCIYVYIYIYNLSLTVPHPEFSFCLCVLLDSLCCLVYRYCNYFYPFWSWFKSICEQRLAETAFPYCAPCFLTAVDASAITMPGRVWTAEWRLWQPSLSSLSPLSVNIFRSPQSCWLLSSSKCVENRGGGFL